MLEKVTIARISLTQVTTHSEECEGTAADEAVANMPATAVHKREPRMAFKR
jgi:hypothetical protein